MSEHPDEDASKLAEQANQIAAFFRPYPEREACAGIAGHIAEFWPPVKRRALGALIARGGGGLDPLLVRALSSPVEQPQA
ncbi:MAG: formate dehydrogenase subunit delta [Proteobacteria bacterium]|nr:formate dehydrogenase subunit delta [Pseudomonadota bacterium]